ncbi:MAG: endospore germination permease [Eubacteriales bacterium]
MKSVVNNRQLFFLLIITISGISLTSLPKNAIEASGNGAWFSLLLLAILFSVGSIFVTTLNKKFEGKTINEYSSLLIGKIGSKIISVIYSIYFLLVIVLLIRVIGTQINSGFLPNTPLLVILIVIIATTSYIGSRGITNIARLCEIYGIIFIVTMIVLHTTMLFFGDVKYIMPFFEVGQIKQYMTGMGKLIVPFLGIEILMLIPFGRGNKNSTITVFLAIMFIGLFYIFSVESSTMITGPLSIVTTENSLIEALRETRIPMTFLLERPDLIFILVGISGFISTLSVVFHMANSSISHLVTKKSNSNLMPILTPVVFIFSTFVLNDKSTELLMDKVLPVIGLTVAFLIPIIMLIIAKVKKL